MKTMKKTIPVCTLLLLLSFWGSGQTKNELQNQISDKEKEIQSANRVLEETQENRSSSLNELYIIRKRIELRNELIDQLSKQIDNLDHNIHDLQAEISELKNELEKLRENYAKIIYYAFKNRKSMDRLMFILSAESFNQAYKRYKYLNQYAEFRRNQAREIQVKSEKLKLRIQELENTRHQKEDILSSKVEEKAKLKREQKLLSRKITSLKSKEKELRQEIADKKRIVNQLEKEIERIIREERERTRLWKNLTADQRAISEAFEKTQGKLPWPITNGIVTKQFGDNDHPVLKGVKIYNNGIDISTTRNSKVKCIFPGVARKVVSIPGANLTVIVRHGNYLSVYSNLVDVNVKVGDKLKQGQVIGEVYTDTEKNESILHLEIYKENEKMNPERWLK
jgi:septal ring factor EnvC (AmiA/AmiB activator)